MCAHTQAHTGTHPTFAFLCECLAWNTQLGLVRTAVATGTGSSSLIQQADSAALGPGRSRGSCLPAGRRPSGKVPDLGLLGGSPHVGGPLPSQAVGQAVTGTLPFGLTFFDSLALQSLCVLLPSPSSPCYLCPLETPAALLWRWPLATWHLAVGIHPVTAPPPPAS